MSDTVAISGSHPVLDCTAAADWEHTLLGDSETAQWSAMCRAGSSVGASLLADMEEIGGLSDNARVLTLCGKGHNGGDALIALHTILRSHPSVSACVWVVPGFAAMRPLVRRAVEELYQAFGGRVEWLSISGAENGRAASRVDESLERDSYDLCIDGLFGMQFRPPFRDPVGWLVARINATSNIKVRAAVDLPSGVGDSCAQSPFRADFTYATGIAKSPAVEAENSRSVGRQRYLDIGFFDGAGAPDSDTRVLTDQVLEPLRALRPAQDDKRAFGHLFIVSGSRCMPGAVLMAVKSALLSGVGLVTAFVPETLAASFAAQLPEAMWVPMPETLEGGLALEGRRAVVARAARCTALLAGPGMGRERETHALMAELLRAIDVPTVLDADALDPEILSARNPKAEFGLVLTPHAGEFKRMTCEEDAGVDSLKSACERLRATIVLKGAPTRISDGKRVYVSPFGGPVLARGGSGDILAGLVGGQLARGGSLVEGVARAVVWHGAAADKLARIDGQNATRVTALADVLPLVLQSGESHD
jgi:NAD(P)H-hydrate epimerase